MLAKDQPPEDCQVPAILSHELILLPHAELVVTLSDKRSAAAIEQALRENRLVAFIPSSDSGRIGGMIGTLTAVEKGDPIHEGVQVLLKGLWRIRINSLSKQSPNSRVSFARIAESAGDSERGLELMKRVHSQLDEFVKLIAGIPPEIIGRLKRAETPGKLADLCALSPTLNNEERLELLNTLDPEKRLSKITEHFERQLDALRRIGSVMLIPECETCMDFADRVFEADPAARGEIALSFLNHAVQQHTGELLGLLAEKYGPVFMKKRALR